MNLPKFSLRKFGRKKKNSRHNSDHIKCVCRWSCSPFVSHAAIRTARSCACWRPTTQTTWLCRSTSRCCRPSSTRTISPSCGCGDWGGSNTCWAPPRTATRTRTSNKISTAFWLRWVALMQTILWKTQRKNAFENVIEPCAHLCLCRTPRLTTAGYRRLRATTGRNDFSTSGCLKSSCTTLRRKTRTVRVQTARTRSRTCRDALQLTWAGCFDRAEDSVAVFLSEFWKCSIQVKSESIFESWAFYYYILLLRCQHFKVS